MATTNLVTPDGNRILEERYARHFSQVDFANKCNVGVKTLAKAEHGDAVQFHVIESIALFLGIRPDDLILRRRHRWVRIGQIAEREESKENLELVLIFLVRALGNANRSLFEPVMINNLARGVVYVYFVDGSSREVINLEDLAGHLIQKTRPTVANELIPRIIDQLQWVKLSDEQIRELREEFENYLVLNPHGRFRLLDEDDPEASEGWHMQFFKIRGALESEGGHRLHMERINVLWETAVNRNLIDERPSKSAHGVCLYGKPILRRLPGPADVDVNAADLSVKDKLIRRLLRDLQDGQPISAAASEYRPGYFSEPGRFHIHIDAAGHDNIGLYGDAFRVADEWACVWKCRRSCKLFSVRKLRIRGSRTHTKSTILVV